MPGLLRVFHITPISLRCSRSAWPKPASRPKISSLSSPIFLPAQRIPPGVALNLGTGAGMRSIPNSDPGTDYRTLLDAMRKAGAEGVAQQVAALAQRIEQDARQRAEWTSQAGGGVNEIGRASWRERGGKEV